MIKINLKIFALSIFLSCSAYAEKKTYFEHPTYGKVAYDSSVYKSELAICEKEVYGDGINIDEQLVKSNDELVSVYSHYMLEQFKTAKSRSEIKPAPFKAEMDAIIEKMKICMSDRGWKKIEK